MAIGLNSLSGLTSTLEISKDEINSFGIRLLSFQSIRGVIILLKMRTSQLKPYFFAPLISSKIPMPECFQQSATSLEINMNVGLNFFLLITLCWLHFELDDKHELCTHVKTWNNSLLRNSLLDPCFMLYFR